MLKKIGYLAYILGGLLAINGLCFGEGSLTEPEFKGISDNIKDQVNKKNAASLFNKAEKDGLRNAALKSLTKAKEKAITPLLKSIASDKAEGLKFRIAALNSLLEMEKEGSDAILEIGKESFKASISPVNTEIKNSWQKFDEKEKPFLVELIDVLGKTKRAEIMEIFEVPMNVKEARPLCAAAMGDVGRPAIPYILTLLGNKDVKVRKGACIGLGKTKEKLVVPALLEILKEEKNIGVKSEAIKSLVLLGDKRALPILEEVKKGAQFKEEKEEYEKAIAAIKAAK